jgi:cytochrome c peroxidase
MTVRTTDTNPNPTELRGKLLVELALLDHQPRPRVDVAPTLDGLLTENEVDLLRAMKAPGAPPPDPTNAYGDLPAAAALGKRLFSDAGLSPSGKVACATCHDASKGLSDGLPQSVGVARTSRNAPSVALAAHSRWQFWDGRADTLWAQALGPLESAKEHGSSRLFVAHRIAEAYAAEYAAVFPAHPLPDLSDGARFPPAGAPGDAAWKGMAGADQNAVTRVFVDVGKAIAAFERTLRVMPNALDRYAGGDVGALSAAEKQGLYVFFKTGCPQCHYGPRLTDDAFHALRFPTGAADGAPDRGRADGAPKLLSAEFTAASPWSDAPAAARSFLGLDGPPPSMVGAFKTPTLRGLPTSGPYGHGGTFATLDEVTKHYGERGLPDGDPRAVGVTEAWVPRFDVHAQHDLVAFLRVLTADLAQ